VCVACGAARGQLESSGSAQSGRVAELEARLEQELDTRMAKIVDLQAVRGRLKEAQAELGAKEAKVRVCMCVLVCACAGACGGCAGACAGACVGMCVHVEGVHGEGVHVCVCACMLEHLQDVQGVGACVWGHVQYACAGCAGACMLEHVHVCACACASLGRARARGSVGVCGRCVCGVGGV